LDEPNDDYDDGDDKKQVNVAAQRVGTYHSEQPQHEKYDKDCPKHF
jgi:hypothetical protein